MRNQWPAVGIAAALLALLIFYPQFGWRLRNYFSGFPAAGEQKLAELQAENEILRASFDLSETGDRAVSEQKGLQADLVAPVYSQYPFEGRDQLLVGVGSLNGAAEGQAVLIPAGPNIGSDIRSAGLLFGKVTKVFKDTAIVTTILDPSWRSTVRIGQDNSEAVLSGGLKPKITLIAKDAFILPGDAVISADESLPYGLLLGEVAGISPDPDQTFQNADIDLSWANRSISKLLIITGYESASSH